MNYSLIGKIEKAKRYAQERDRITFTAFTATFRGEHDTYTISYHDHQWHCTCPYFVGHRVCSHSMALERILAEMLPEGTPAVTS